MRIVYKMHLDNIDLVLTRKHRLIVNVEKYFKLNRILNNNNWISMNLNSLISEYVFQYNPKQGDVGNLYYTKSKFYLSI